MNSGSGKCELCDVFLPSEAAYKEHAGGKRHLKQVEMSEHRNKLVKQSAFVYGFLSNELNEEQLQRGLQDLFGHVSRVILGSKATHAIVEFEHAQSASDAIQVKKVVIDGHQVLIKEREVNFKESGGIAGAEETAEQLKIGAAKILLETVGSVNDRITALIDFLSAKDGEERTRVIVTLQSAMDQYLPGNSRIELHGSSISGLGIIGCDLDAALFMPDSFSKTDYSRKRKYLLSTDVSGLVGESRVTVDELMDLESGDRVRFICRLLNHVRKVKHLPITNLQPVLSKRCPTVQFVWEHRFSCDLSVQNPNAVRNARWLGRLAGDIRIFRELSFLLRFWGKTAGVVGGDQKVTSYAISLILVTYLLADGLVKEAKKGGESPAESGFVMINQNSDSSSSVLASFLASLCTVDFRNTIISPRQGSFIPISDWKLSADFHADFKQSLLNVQDPFDLSHNTAGQTAQKQATKFCQEIQKAHNRLTKHPEDHLKALFNMYASLTHTAVAASGGRKSKTPDPDQNIVQISGDLFGIGQQKDKCNLTLTAVSHILRQLLDFHHLAPSAEDEADGGAEAMETDDEEPPAKRSRGMTNEAKFGVNWRSWQGRRTKRKIVERNHPQLNPIQTEQEVTKMLKTENSTGSDNNLPGEWIVVLEISVHIASSGDVLIGIQPQQTSQDVNIFVHFLKPFMLKYVPALLSSSSYQNTN